MKSTHKYKLFILAGMFIVFMTTGLGCKVGSLEGNNAIKEPVPLVFWGVFDSKDAYQGIFSAYQSTHPNVSIEYRKLQYAEYERALLDAWAEQRGPDIFLVHNTWVGGYTSKIEPLPPTIKVPRLISEDQVSFVDTPTIPASDIKNRFVPVVAQDAVRDGAVYGLPLSVDTLVLYYNRTLLDQSGVITVPRTWQEVKEASLKTTKLTEEGDIVRTGIALGGAYNINRSFDIVSLLMAQNGTNFVTADGRTSILSQRLSSSINRDFRPGAHALEFYTDFANPAKEVYTWSESQPSATESFIAGNVGMMLGYSYQRPQLEVQGPKIDLGVAPAPHINSDGTDGTGETINWANYWLLTVAKSSAHPETAWDFIQFATANVDNARSYTSNTKRPAALRELVPEQLQDPEMSVFAQQLLTARSWYRGNDAGTVERTFHDMILQLTQGLATSAQAVQQAEGVITRTLR